MSNIDLKEDVHEHTSIQDMVDLAMIATFDGVLKNQMNVPRNARLARPAIVPAT
jgi:hypothetical protein